MGTPAMLRSDRLEITGLVKKTGSQERNTDIFGYSDTAYSDTPLTVRVLVVNPMLPKSGPLEVRVASWLHPYLYRL